MNKAQKTFWFDITTIMRWNSTPVGITKTEMELALQLLKNESIQFCVYKKNRWETVSKDVVLEQINCNTSQKTDILSSNTAKRNVNYLKHFVRRTTKPFIAKATSGIFFPLRPAIKQWLQASANLARVLHLCLKEARLSKKMHHKSLNKGAAPCPFFAGDIYFSAGLNWDDKDYKHLYALKEKIGFHVVTVCYDMIPYLFPHFYTIAYTRKTLFPYFVDMIWTTDHFICISESTQKDLQEFASKECAVQKLSTSVIKLGCTIPHQTGESTKNQFCLAVSTIEPRKNYDLLYRVWLTLIERSPENTPMLIIVGKVGWCSQDLVYSLKNDPRVKEKIVIKESISDQELHDLYTSCLFTLYPSFYEGWGLPIVESLGRGKICVSSDGSSMREASQNMAIHLPPHDVTQWANVVSKLVDDSSYRSEIEKNIIENYKTPSWQNTTSEVLEIINARYSTNF